MYHDEYDVHFTVYGSEAQIEAVIMASCLKNTWHIIEPYMTRSKTESGRHALTYIALNEKIWDIEKDVEVLQEMTRIARTMGLENRFTSRRCR